MISRLLLARARLSSFGDRLRAFEEACRPLECPCTRAAAATTAQVHGSLEVCPKCGSDELIFMTPMTPGPDGWGWRCKACGHQWDLTIDEEPVPAGGAPQLPPGGSFAEYVGDIDHDEHRE